MKYILSLIISGALVVSGFGQTRNVLVGTNNAVVQPTNFWSADASNARTGLGLGTSATNPASAFQPSSATLSNLAASNGGNLTNLQSANLVGIIPASNIPSTTLTNISGTLSIASGGTGATNAGGARTNLGLGWTALANTNSATSLMGLVVDTGATNIFYVTGAGSPSNSIIFTNPVELSGGAHGLRIADGTNEAWDFPNDAAAEFYYSFGFYGANASNNAATARTNLGLGATWLTNTNAPVFVNTNGEVVSPTNFWQVAPISTTVQYQTNVTGTSTNAATNSRNLFLFSLSPSVSGITNTVTLPTNPATTFEGDRATVTHLAQTTNAVTAIRQLGAATNIITLNQLDETVLLMYRSGAWILADNISYIEPIYFSGTNAAANAAASRTNLGLGATWLTNTNVTNFRTAIGLGEEDSPQFDDISSSSANISQISANAIGMNGAISWTGTNATANAATTRTNLGLGSTNNVIFLSLITANTNGSLINLDPSETLGQSLTGIGRTSNSIYFTYAAFTYLEANTNGWTVHRPFSFSSDGIRLGTLTNLQLASTNIVTFAGITNNGDITINSTTASNGLLYIRRTNNEPFLGLANLIASNNTTISNETLFRVGVSEATNKAAQFGFRSTNTNGNGVAVFSVFGYNALMMIGPSDPEAGTNPIEATVYSVNPTNKVMTLIRTNTGATMFHRPIEFENTTNQAVTRTNLGLGQTNSVTFSSLTLSSDLTFGSGDNIVLSTTNGTKIGTATNQLLGFYNQTPIVQPSTTGVTTNGFTQGSGNNVHPNSTFTGGIGTNAYTISDIVAHLKSLGLIAP